MGGVYGGLGVGVGTFVSGVIFNNFGSTVLFASFICWLFFSFLLFAFANYVFSRREAEGKSNVIASGKYSGLINAADDLSKPLLSGDKHKYDDGPSKKANTVDGDGPLTESQKILLAQPPPIDGAM